jgi:hypothetical protein
LVFLLSDFGPVVPGPVVAGVRVRINRTRVRYCTEHLFDVKWKDVAKAWPVTDTDEETMESLPKPM